MILYQTIGTAESRGLPVLLNADEPVLWENERAVLLNVFQRLALSQCSYLVCFGHRAIEAIAIAKEVLWETAFELGVAPSPGYVLLALPTCSFEEALELFQKHVTVHFNDSVILTTG